YQWQHYDEQCNLLEQLLRQVFLCLECEAGKGSEAVVAQLQQMQTEIAFGGPLKRDCKIFCVSGCLSY
ncbi:hypothetical protein B7943_09600, partial [Vibrio cholerae]